jgi:hypothetical protein
MRWMFGSFLGEENGFIRSENIENSHPFNVCLYDAVQVGAFQVKNDCIFSSRNMSKMKYLMAFSLDIGNILLHFYLKKKTFSFII